MEVTDEEFQKNYSMNEKIENLNQESHKEVGKIMADSVFRIGNALYHAECQSYHDKTIAVRILEYDFYIAMKEMEENEEGIYEVAFPKSCVIYLKHNKDTPDNMTVRVRVSDETVFDYKVPVIKVQDYSLDEIFEKNLFLFLPFYVMKYEGNIKDITEDSKQLQEIISKYREIINRMEKAFQNNLLVKDGMRLSAELQRIMKRTAEYFFRENEKAREQIGGAIMGGTAWKTFTDELQERDTELQAKDTELKKKDMVIRIIKAKMKGMSEEDIAKEEGISVEEVKSLL